MRQLLCPSIVGREAEIESLESALDSAGAGRGGVVLVSGEPGVGKSRLARELAASARGRNFSVLAGRAMDSPTPSAFGPFSEALLSYFRSSHPPAVPELEGFKPALARLVPQWCPETGISPEQSLVVLAEAVVRLLATIAGGRGCLLVLEDLHWADPETLAIIDYFSDTLESERVLCVGTLRSDEAGAASALHASMHSRRSALLVELRRLDDSGVEAMTRACLASEVPVEVCEAIAAFSDGVPFLVEELLVAWADAEVLVRSDAGWTISVAEPIVPPSFAETVCRRLDAIGEDARLILGAAAVFGPRFDWSLLVAATHLEEHTILETLRGAVRAQLCVADSPHAGNFRFRHALTRHAVLGELLPMERRALAAKLLTALEDSHGDLSGDAAQQAVELADMAGQHDRAARLLLAAAHGARARGALSTAEAFLGRAFSLAGGKPTMLTAINRALTEVLAAAGKPLAALEVGEPLCRPGSGLDASELPALRLVLARAATLGGLWEEADRHVALARSSAPVTDSVLLAHSDLAEAQMVMAQKRPGEAMHLAQRALGAAKDAGLAGVAGEALMIMGRGERLHDLASASASFAEALEWAERAGSVDTRVAAAFELATIPLLDGGPIDPLLEARAAALDAGVPVTAAYVDLMLAHRHEDRLEIELVRQAAQRCADAARRYRLKPLLGSALTQLGFAHGALGDRASMEEALATAFAAAGDDPDVVAGTSIARGMVSLLAEDRGRAIRHLDAAMDTLRSSQATYPAPHRALWALLHVVEDDEVAEEALAEVKQSPAIVHRGVRGLLACADAVRLGRQGRRGEADEQWKKGDADLSSFEGRQYVARRLAAEDAIRHGWGEPVRWLEEAAEFFEQRHVARLATACRSLLRAAGAPAPRRTRVHDGVPEELRHAGVTTREMEVLDLLAEGISTAAIAARLYLSAKTVERHTSNLAAKLGLAGRAQVVAFAATQRVSRGPAGRDEGPTTLKMGDPLMS